MPKPEKPENHNTEENPFARIAREVASTPTDPRIIEILRAFDRARESPARDEDLLRLFMDRVVGFLWSGWTDRAMESVLYSYVLNAPTEDLDEMVADARGFLPVVDELERDGAA